VHVLGFDRRATLSVLWPPYLAGWLMVGVVYPLDRAFLHAGTHGVAAGIGLLALETIAGLAVYLACLLAFSPPTAQALASVTRGAQGRLRAVLS
jgi:hypothetical protein